MTREHLLVNFAADDGSTILTRARVGCPTSTQIRLRVGVPVPAPVVTQNALPDDPELDLFESGDEEVDHYFHGRGWFDVKKEVCSPPTYVCRLDPSGPAIGYVSVGHRQVPHPVDASAATARYLTIYALGVDKAYQGVANPLSPGETVAASILNAVEGVARQRPDCVGMSLWVRSTNARAIRFYLKMGFVADPSGPRQRGPKGPPHLSMRRAF